MNGMIIIGLDTADIIYLKNKGRKIKEFYGAFEYKPKEKDLVDARLPFAYKIDSKKQATDEKYIGELMTIAEYFNTKTSEYIFAQVRTRAVIDGVDRNTYTYADNDQFDILIEMFGINKVKDKKTFDDQQYEENVEGIENGT